MLSKAGNEGATPSISPLNYPLTFGFCLVDGPWEEICAQYPSLPFRWVKNSLFCQISIWELKSVTQEGVFKEAWEAFRERGEWVRKGHMAKVKGFEWQDLKAKGLLLIFPRFKH